MTFGDWALLGTVLTVLVVIAGYWLCWHLAYKDGWDDGRDYEQERQYMKSIRARSAAERSRERRGSSLPAAPWYTQAPKHAVSRPRRVVTTADDIAPVIVPHGATTVPWFPQPGRTSGPGTVTMPKLALTSTGEMRALTDDFIEGMAAREEAYRQELTP